MNVRSLLPKRDEVLAYVAVENPNVIAITETWIKRNYLMSQKIIAQKRGRRHMFSVICSFISALFY